MAAQRVPYVSPEQYLEWEREAEFKSEYHAGEIYAMSGANEPHSIINCNLAGLMYAARRGGKCRVYQNDMRVAIRDGLRYVYPDTVAVCGERIFQDSELDILMNPTVIIEILSPSTETYDRGFKFRCYQQIESLQEYVMVSQTPCEVEIFRRDAVNANGEEWRYTRTNDCAATVTIHSLGVSLTLADLYEGVETPDEETDDKP